MFFIYQFVRTMYNSNVQLKGMEELKLYHSILSWYDLVTLFTLYLYGEKIKKADPPISGHSLPTTASVFNFEHYLVWFGNFVYTILIWGEN